MAKKRINLPYDRASDGPRVPVFVAARRSAAAIHGSTSCGRRGTAGVPYRLPQGSADNGSQH